MQRVDSFIPATTPRQPPPSPTQPQVLDGVRRPVPQPEEPADPVQAPPPQPSGASIYATWHAMSRDPVHVPASGGVRAEKPQKPKRSHVIHPLPKLSLRLRIPSRVGRALRLPLCALGVILAGLLLPSIIMGEIAVVLYAVAALVWRIRSGFTFALAFCTLLAAIVLMATSRGALANNFAVYAFLLLVAGVVTLGREMREIKPYEV